MLLTRWTQRFYDTTRGRIVALLRRASLTVDQIAAALGLTDNAVRAHLTSLERDGLVKQSRLAKREGGGPGKPAYLYSVAPDAEPLFSSAYIPILTQLLDVLGERMSSTELDQLMHAVGRRLAADQSIPPGDLRRRAAAAVAILNDLGGVAELEDRADGTIDVRGYSCALGAAVRGHPEVCAAVQTMLSQVIGAPVRERCDRGERPRCCFEVGATTARDLEHPRPKRD